MPTKDDITDRLLTDARKKTARLQSPMLAKAAMIVGIVAVLVSWITIAGWILGTAALSMGVPGMQRSVAAKQARIAVVLGVIALVIATFFFTLNIALRR